MGSTHHVRDLLTARNQILNRQPVGRLEQRLDHARHHAHMRDPDIRDVFPELGEQFEARRTDEARAEAPALADLGDVDVEGGRWAVGLGFGS